MDAFLNACESAIAQAKEFLGAHQYPGDSRTVVVLGIVDTMIEHHTSAMMLIRAKKTGSAFALFRSIVEGMYRGLWFNLCATDAQVRLFERKDTIRPSLGELAEAIDDKYRAGGFFARLKERAWQPLNSYAHTGMLQLGRRFTGQNVQPAYSTREVGQVSSAATTCVLILASKFLAVQGFRDEALKAASLIGSWGPRPT